MQSEEHHIIEEIVAYIQNTCKCNPDSWYTGVASDPLRCLQYEHGISIINSLCIMRRVSSADVASDVVSTLINQYGLSGKITVDNDENSLFVYAFQENKTSFFSRGFNG